MTNLELKFGPCPIDDDVCTGMDVPIAPWTQEDITFWTGTKTYQPWKDVAAFFKKEDKL